MRIRSLGDIDCLSRADTILCLYSGGLDGTYLLYKLARLGFQGVLALRVDLGGDPLPERATRACEKLGVELVDADNGRDVPAKGVFARDFVFAAIRAQARYLGGHPICASLSRPLIAKIATEIAAVRGASCIIHTSDRSQNSLRRFNGALRDLKYPGIYGSPFECEFISREQKSSELRQANILGFDECRYSGDSNIWGREFEASGLDDPENVVIPETLYRWTTTCEQAETAAVTLTFKNGIPVQLDLEDVSPVQLIESLNRRVGRFGLGRYVGLEEIGGGEKVQEVREMPAAYLLLDAYRRLEAGCLPAESIRTKIDQEQLWVREAVEGRWFGVLREAAEAFIQAMSRAVSGRISYCLRKNDAQATSTICESPLYVRDRNEIGQES